MERLDGTKAISRTKTKITPEYVNNKLEQILSALFDTLEENEDRIKHMEAQVHKLTAEVRNGKAE